MFTESQMALYGDACLHFLILVPCDDVKVCLSTFTEVSRSSNLVYICGQGSASSVTRQQ